MRVSILLLLAACASTGSSYGTVSFKSSVNYAARPMSFSVGKGRISGSTFDAYLDGNCVRGAYGRIPIDFCRDDKGDQAVQHWAGSSGEFTVRQEGEQVVVDGAWVLDMSRRASMAQRVTIGEGAQWAELKRNPALIAVAATAVDLQSVNIRR